MVSKREVAWQLKRHELQDVLGRYGVEVRGDGRVLEDLVDSIVRARRVSLREMLEGLSRARLKQICRELELDDGGREKSLLIDRLTGEESDDLDDEDDSDAAGSRVTDEPREAGIDVVALLARLLRSSLTIEASTSGWPVKGSMQYVDRRLDVEIYVRAVVGSHRDPLERRIQNPNSRRPITDNPKRHNFLFGIWRERGDDTAVIVAFDPEIRLARTTRYSCFLPLSLAEEATETGFSMHINTKGERIYAFRPENLDRYLQALMETGDLRESELSPVKPSARRSPAEEMSAAPGSVDSLNIRPKVGMYASFARLNYKAWFAVAEFVDNSIQSFLTHRAALRDAGVDGPLQIDIFIDDAEIRISDLAGGIALKDFPRAFSPATPPDDTSGLSEFGLGMKAAACWFAERWSVRTSALGDPFEREVSFDVPKIAREGIEQLPVMTRPTRENDHFTVISLRGLRKRLHGNTLAKLRSHLASIYRVLLGDGTVRIRLTTASGSEDLKFEAPELLSAPYYREPGAPSVLWHREFTIKIDEKRVTGWAGIMKHGSRTQAGFSVFRRKRLIEGSVGETYKPYEIFGASNSFESLRIIGEMHVEGFDVSHTKDGIQWGDDEDRVIEEIHTQINTNGPRLIEQAKGYRARKTAEQLPPNFGADALEGVAVDLQGLEVVESPPVVEDEPAPTPVSAPNVFQYRETELHFKHEGKPWKVRIELVRERTMEFYRVNAEKRTDGSASIAVLINLDHDFSIAWLNENENAMHPMVRLIAAVALGEHLGVVQGIKYASWLRKNTNEWLRLMMRENQEVST
jgi:hypothetical protein